MRVSLSTAVVALLVVAGKGLAAPLYPPTCYFGICPMLPGITKGSDDGSSNYKARDLEHSSDNMVKRVICYFGICPMLPNYNKNNDGESNNKARDVEPKDVAVKKRSYSSPTTCHFGICPMLPSNFNNNEGSSNNQARDVEPVEKRTGPCYFGFCVPNFPAINDANNDANNKARDIEVENTAFEEPASLDKRSVVEIPAYELAE